MKVLRFMLVMVVAGSALAFAGCGQAKSDASKPTEEHTDDDGHDHSEHEDHSGHNH